MDFNEDDKKEYKLLYDNLESMLIGHIIGQSNYRVQLVRYLELKRKFDGHPE